MDLADLFNGSEELPFWAFAIRATILYWALMMGTRLMGHRQVGILAGHNYLVAAGIVSLGAVRMVNSEASMTAALVIIFVYVGMNVLLSYLDIKWPKWIDRSPVILVENGKLNRKNLMDTHVTIDNLIGQLRLKGVFKLSEVAAAVLEPTGKISVLKKMQSLPVTRKQMNLPPKPAAASTVLVYNGEVDVHALNQLGLTREWLIEKLGRQGVSGPKDAFVAVLEDDGTLSVSV